MKKQQTNEGVLRGAERFVNAFFDGLKKGAADQVIKKAEKAKLPPRAIKAMEDLKRHADEVEDIFADL